MVMNGAPASQVASSRKNRPRWPAPAGVACQRLGARRRCAGAAVAAVLSFGHGGGGASPFARAQEFGGDPLCENTCVTLKDHFATLGLAQGTVVGEFQADPAAASKGGGSYSPEATRSVMTAPPAAEESRRALSRRALQPARDPVQAVRVVRASSSR